jgi:hypothetical protein
MMNDINHVLPAHLKKLVDIGEEPLNIIHGELKNLMHESEVKLERCDQNDEREWLDGYMQALTDMYKLTYDLYFAFADRENNEGY